ncbi:MAG TPA: ABC transporter ATP-binding protein [Candidatus Sumerlaeota bacterium]|nr:ABC transporter ATP-binding protein [Candidatus Sumerlaeota bacterium]
MIRVEDLTKTYGSTEAIRDVSFHVPRGEILGFLGPNGAGKTTTMRILTCNTLPSSGQAFVAGHNVVSDSLRARASLGYMPEVMGLYEDMTVNGYLEFMSGMKGLAGTEKHRILREIMERTGLAGVRQRLIRNLSKGFRQRVGLAQALSGDPEVLIMDEPTVGLDPAQIREFRELVADMRGRRTVILSTHILQEVAAVCTRVAIISLGRLAAVGTIGELTERYAGGNRVRVTAGGDEALALRTLKGVAGVKNVVCTVADLPEQGRVYEMEGGEGEPVGAEAARALCEAGCAVHEITPVRLGLEEIYMKAIMGE